MPRESLYRALSPSGNPRFSTLHAILRAAGLDVERHADHFAPAAPDEEWLAVAGAQGWLAITHDARIRYKPNELAAVKRNRVALLVVVGDLPFGSF